MAFVLLPPVTGGLAAFRAFLKSEYSEENIDFWVSCEEYKKIKSPSKLTPKAQKIYNEFISVQAAKEVGLCGVPSRCSQGAVLGRVSPRERPGRGGGHCNLGNALKPAKDRALSSRGPR